jgi:ketosteroid isomerase-like protein
MEEFRVHPFRAAVEARDTAAVEASLADDVVFTSPNTFKPYRGKAITAAFLRAVLRVLEDFRYVRQIADAGGRDHAFIFEARIGDTQVFGCDLVHCDADGKIAADAQLAERTARSRSGFSYTATGSATATTPA